MESEGRKIHGQAAHAREEGKHLESLQLSDEAMLAYQKAGDILGLSEILADRSIVFRHLADDTSDQNFLIIAKHEMMASVEMAEKNGQPSAVVLPYFNLAKVLESLEELEEARNFYQKTIDGMATNPPEMHNRPAVLADMRIHLSTCQYKIGDKSALQGALDAINDLEQTDETKYNKDVWLSGGHMRIAEMLKTEDSTKAKEHLQKAKEIIDSNPDLKIRKTQWEKLVATFS